MRSENRVPGAPNEPGFAHIRKPECLALRRCKPRAYAVFIFIRSVLATNENKSFACGSRDFTSVGLGRDAAAAALKELEREGLIICIERGSFRRGKKAVFRIVHTRVATENTAGKPANPKADTAVKSAKLGRGTRQLRQNTAGYSDTPKDTSSTSSQKSKEEEVFCVRDSAPVAAAAQRPLDEADGEEPEAEAKRKIDQGEWRKMDVVIDKVAAPMHMKTIGFIDAFGGAHDRFQDRRKAAFFLCWRYLRGEVTKSELMAQQAGSSACSAKKESP